MSPRWPTDNLTPVQAKLFEIASERGSITAAVLDDPPWDATSLSSWTKYVPGGIYQIWSELSLEARLVAYIHAERDAQTDTNFDI